MSRHSFSGGLQTAEFVARANIDRLARLLSAETDTGHRTRLSALLSEEHQKLNNIAVRHATTGNPLIAPERSAGQTEPTLLEQLCDRLAQQRTFEDAVAATLEAAIGLVGSHYGNVQLPTGDRLFIVKNRGFAKPFLDTFREVRIGDGSACGRAFQQRRPVVIVDVAEDAEFAPFRPDAAAAGFRGVVTAPMITPGGLLMGFVSTHLAHAHSPTAGELQSLSALCSIAGGQLQRLLGADRLDAKARHMQAAVYRSAMGFCDPK